MGKRLKAKKPWETWGIPDPNSEATLRERIAKMEKLEVPADVPRAEPYVPPMDADTKATLDVARSQVAQLDPQSFAGFGGNPVDYQNFLALWIAVGDKRCGVEEANRFVQSYNATPWQFITPDMVPSRDGLARLWNVRLNPDVLRDFLKHTIPTRLEQAKAALFTREGRPDTELLDVIQRAIKADVAARPPAAGEEDLVGSVTMELKEGEETGWLGGENAEPDQQPEVEPLPERDATEEALV